MISGTHICEDKLSAEMDFKLSADERNYHVTLSVRGEQGSHVTTFTLSIEEAANLMYGVHAQYRRDRSEDSAVVPF